jgi:uncharacterized protein
MDDLPLNYDEWVEEALRAVVRRALGFASQNGLPGEHHFYITFRTGAEDVRMPARLRARHPEEMTIVLQNQFWDLEVEDDKFSVTLNFSRISERLSIPYAAVTTFGDPHASFGLQLKTNEDGTDLEDLRSLDVPALDETRDADRPSDDEGEATGEVITLDAFRKK